MLKAKAWDHVINQEIIYICPHKLSPTLSSGKGKTLTTLSPYGEAGRERALTALDQSECSTASMNNPIVSFNDLALDLVFITKIWWYYPWPWPLEPSLFYCVFTSNYTNQLNNCYITQFFKSNWITITILYINILDICCQFFYLFSLAHSCCPLYIQPLLW